MAAFDAVEWELSRLAMGKKVRPLFIVHGVEGIGGR
jgi:hypothetical protein